MTGSVPVWLSTRQCGSLIGMTTEFIRGEIRDGRLPACKLARDGKRPAYRVRVEDFDTYLDRYWSRATRPATRQQSH